MKLKYYFDIDDLRDILFDHLDMTGKLPSEDVAWDIEADIRMVLSTESGEEELVVVLNMKENTDAASEKVSDD